MHKISFFIFFFLTVITLSSFSQSAVTMIEQGKDLDVLYRNEATGGIMIHSRGFGISYRQMKHVTGTRKRFLEAELLGMRHPKEFKRLYEGKSGANRGFYYGKLNGLAMLRLGFGYQNTLYERAERKSVEVRYAYSIGPNITFAKPVYIYVKHPPNEQNTTIEQYDPEKHDLNQITGRAPFLYGLGNLKVYPGGYARLGFSFDFADFSNEVKALETGVVVDVLPYPVPIMAKYEKEQVFVTLYISFIFGKKWF